MASTAERGCMEKISQKGSDGRSREADDRCLPVTRIVAVIVIPFSLLVFVILYSFPGQTGLRFAWESSRP
jgi:hypothetical protein